TRAALRRRRARLRHRGRDPAAARLRLPGLGRPQVAVRPARHRPYLGTRARTCLSRPRRPGLIWGRADAWNSVTPTIPTFDGRAFRPWMEGRAPDMPRAAAMSPGGFHTFEHRWALAEAFAFRRRIGRARAATRTHALAQRLKNGLAEVKGVRLVTPQASNLSAGIVCFEVEGRDPFD